MEKRLLVAIIVSFLILALYQVFFMKKVPPAEPAPAAAAAAEQPSSQPAGAPAQAPSPIQAAPAAAQPQPQPQTRPVAAQAEEEVLVETSLFTARWSNRGAVLKSLKLKKYLDESKEGLELVPSRAAELGVYPFGLLTGDAAFDAEANGALFQASLPALDLKDGEGGELVFRYATEAGTQVEKTIQFKGGSYVWGLKFSVLKDGQKADAKLVWGPGIGNPTAAELKSRLGTGGGAAVDVAGKVSRISEKKYKPDQASFNFVNWAAYEETYFAALFFLPGENGLAAFLQKTKEADASPYYILAVSLPEKAFIGPKEYDLLLAQGRGAKNLISFGFFGWMAEILLRGLRFFHGLIPNWGVAIIILTLIIKIIFFPLTYSSTKSMAKMQEIQPKIKALRAKYKKAKQDIAQRRQLNEEMMRLYKEHGINPAGGCLPILIQLPVFWGFFRILSVGIEFRHSPFLLWIKDLSVKDPYYVTPILMGVTQYIQQKMTPTGADPAQARMMLIMPVVMTVFFMNFQSGLVLYWLTNNVLQIGQQAIMNRMMKNKKREAHGQRNPGR
jgi:YidC/Oxa1 family membrane protein insertase